MTLAAPCSAWRAAWLSLVLVAAFAPAPALSQATPAPSQAAAQASPGAVPVAPPAPVAIPVPEIIERSDAVLARLQQFDAEVATDAQIESFGKDLAEVDARLKRHSRDADDLLEAGARLYALEPADRALTDVRNEIQTISDRLTAVATELEQRLDELSLSREVWKITKLEAAKSGAPEATLDRIDQTLGAMRATRDRLRQRRTRVLEMQEQASNDQATASDVLGQIDTYRREFADRLFRRDAPPIWQLDLGARARGDIVERFGTMVAAEWTDARLLIPTAMPRLVLQALLFVGLYLAFRTGQHRMKEWSEEDPTLEPAALVFESPISAALLLTLALTSVIHPRIPYLLGLAISLVALPAALHTLVPLVGDRLRSALFVVGAFFIVDRLRDVAAPAPEVEQAILCVQLGTALLLLLLLLRSGRIEGVHVPAEQLGRLRVLGWLVRGLAWLVAVALAATALGFMQLARVLAAGALNAVYLGFGLLAIARALDGLVAFLLRVQPLCRTRSVQLHRRLIERRVQRFLGIAAWGLFGYAVLRTLHLSKPLGALVAEVGALEFVPGDSKVTISDVAFFALILLGAYQLSRFVVFALEADVYPRLHLQRGLPYAISTLTRYTLFTLGFFLAISALGIDLSKVTVLAGALGVGIGFGLQNVVNNFVSGLILLFERPIQVGDTVQIQNLMGEVRRIGMRSSTLRTADGAEVIVPNANLIQDSVTNWTLSDNSRRVEIPVGVAYGTEPQQVIALLKEVATTKREVLKDPEPVALFVGFAESSLDFVLRCWLMQSEHWVTVRSDIFVAVHDALREAGIEIPFPQRDLHLKLGTGPAPPREPGPEKAA